MILKQAAEQEACNKGQVEFGSPGEDGVEPVCGHLGLDEEEQRLREADDPSVHHVLRGAVARLAPRELLAAGAVVVVLDVLECGQ